LITNQGDPLFPYNAVTLLAARFQMIDTDLFVCKRKLYTTDPAQAIGVSAALWSPDPQSYQMRGTLSTEPSIQRYEINVQALVKDTDEENGIAVSSKLSKIVRGIILTDVPLRDSLRSLSSTLYGVTERTLRWSIPAQRYLSQELSGQFVYLSTIQVQLETENTSG
jgi:hypothetical protein